MSKYNGDIINSGGEKYSIFTLTNNIRKGCNISCKYCKDYTIMVVRITDFFIYCNTDNNKNREKRREATDNELLLIGVRTKNEAIRKLIKKKLKGGMK